MLPEESIAPDTQCYIPAMFFFTVTEEGQLERIRGRSLYGGEVHLEPD